MQLMAATNPQDMAEVRALRHEVFVIEQQVPPELEWDGQDEAAHHLLARAEGVAAGTLRWRQLEDMAKIERVCVARAFRGQNVGALLMMRVLDDIRATPGITRVRLGAQVSVIGFYERLGFVAQGPVFDDAGIPHRDMVLDLS